MKKKLSISIDEKMIEVVETLSQKTKFRNKSHVVEYALEKLMEEEKE
jgi:Arc/MetJ-type ribon-helix-helix transcriptional regulator